MKTKMIDQKKQDEIISAVQLFRAGRSVIIDQFCEKQ
jgi:hypothetical protein